MNDPRVGLASLDETAKVLLQLAETRIIIRVAAKDVHFNSTRLAATRAADLVARLFDNVAIEIVGDNMPAWASAANARIREIRDVGELPKPTKDVVIGVGDVSADVNVSASGWTVFVAHADPRPMEEGIVGGLLAGPLLAAEAFKIAFQSSLVGAVHRDYIYNSLTCDDDPSADAPIEDVEIDAALVGSGSIGFGFTDALRAAPIRLRGKLTPIDNGILEDRNVYKYAGLLTAEAIDGAEKVAVIERWLGEAHPDLAIDPRAGLIRDADDVLASVAVIAPDNLPARRDGQELLSKDVVNVAIVGTIVDVASLRFGTTQCVYCYYRNAPEESVDYARVAALTGLAVDYVKRAYLDNVGLTAAEIAVIAEQPAFAKAELDAFVGQPLRSLMQRGFYSEAEITGPGRSSLPVTTAFVSAMAGTLAFVEMLKLGMGLERYRLRTHFAWNLLGVFRPGFVLHHASEGRCAICLSKPRLNEYSRRWSLA
jgi:hypothetical protein